MFRNSSLLTRVKYRRLQGRQQAEKFVRRQLYFVTLFAAFSFAITSVSFTIMPASLVRSIVSLEQSLLGNSWGNHFLIADTGMLLVHPTFH